MILGFLKAMTWHLGSKGFGFSCARRYFKQSGWRVRARWQDSGLGLGVRG